MERRWRAAVEVQDLHKSFQIPVRERPSLKSRFLHPLRRRRSHELRVIEGISFQIGQGEFFSVVGRNGSGKSTLLRMLASIYSPDRGSIKVAGRVAPVIELGVGLSPALSGRRNVVFGGVLLGLTPREARRTTDEVLAFSELEEFAEVPLKDYSSGMRVRLAFALMMQMDPDVMLVDEVLAVGDAAFQRKCVDALVQRRDAGKTIVLVSHRMPTVERYSDRAMLLNRGLIERIGNPEEVTRRYLELNSENGIPLAQPNPADSPPQKAAVGASPT